MESYIQEANERERITTPMFFHCVVELIFRMMKSKTCSPVSPSKQALAIQRKMTCLPKSTIARSSLMAPAAPTISPSQMAYRMIHSVQAKLLKFCIVSCVYHYAMLWMGVQIWLHICTFKKTISTQFPSVLSRKYVSMPN